MTETTPAAEQTGTPVWAQDCTVTVDRYDAHSCLVNVRGRPGPVTLHGPAYRHTAFVDLRARRQVSWGPGRVTLEIPDDGHAWLMVFDAPPPVSAFDYRPTSLLELPASVPDRAASPVVDVHAHLALGPQEAEERVTLMDQLGIDVVVTSAFADRGETSELSWRRFAAVRPDRLVVGATVDWMLVRKPGGPQEMAERLREDHERFGAVLVGEMHDKGFGVDDPGAGRPPRDPVHLDDPRLEPFWRATAELGLPVVVHLGHDSAAYRPWDASNEDLRRLYRAPWARPRPGGLSIEELRRRRDDVLRRHPDVRILAAHLDTDGERLGQVAHRLRRLPNLYLELGSRHRVLARQPRVAARFLGEFADRVCFGGDRVQSAELYREQFRVLESDDDAFAGLDPDDTRPLYGLALPPDVLDQVYRGTAVSLMPGLATTARRVPR